MVSRAIASKVSVTLSLGLLVAVLMALANSIDLRPRLSPAVVRSSDQPTAFSDLAQPRVTSTRPVVLPPAPAPAPTPVTTHEIEAHDQAGSDRKSQSATHKQPKASNVQAQSIAVKTSRGQVGARAPNPPKRAVRKRAEPKPESVRSEDSKSNSSAGPQPPRRNSPKRPVRERPAARLGPKPEAASAEGQGESIIIGQGDVADGRALLRLLEHGSGPAIELAWPDSAKHRERMFTLLRDCFGMQVALMDAENRLYLAKGQPRQAWTPNLDRYSGFIREPAGALSRHERQAAERIRAFHGGLASSHLVRIFPRAIDARLLGGLRRLIGAPYTKLYGIHARYRLNGGRLLVEQIAADGRRIPGRLQLSSDARGACRRAPGT
jgi:hypothetical protein